MVMTDGGDDVSGPKQPGEIPGVVVLMKRDRECESKREREREARRQRKSVSWGF